MDHIKYRNKSKVLKFPITVNTRQCFQRNKALHTCSSVTGTNEMMPRLVVLQMNITEGESTHPFVVPGAPEEHLAAIFLNPSTGAGSPAARRRGRLPHVAVASKRTKPGVGSEEQEGRRGRRPRGERRAMSAPHGEDTTLRRRGPRRRGAMQADRRGGPTPPAPANRVREARRAESSVTAEKNTFLVGLQKRTEERRNKRRKR